MGFIIKSGDATRFSYIEYQALRQPACGAARAGSRPRRACRRRIPARWGKAIVLCGGDMIDVLNGSVERGD